MLTLAPTFSLSNLPLVIMRNHTSHLDAFDVMNSGLKGRIDLQSIGYENVLVMGEIKSPPKNWKADDSGDSEETSYLVLLDVTNK